MPSASFRVERVQRCRKNSTGGSRLPSASFRVERAQRCRKNSTGGPRLLSLRLESRGRRDVERTPLAGLGCLAHRFPAQPPMVARGYSPLTATISAGKSSHLPSEDSLTRLQGMPLLTTGDKRGNARQLPWIHSALWDTVEGSLRKYDA